MMPVLVKSDDVRSGRKAKHCQQAVTGGTGVNGLKYIYKIIENPDKLLSRDRDILQPSKLPTASCKVKPTS